MNLETKLRLAGLALTVAMVVFAATGIVFHNPVCGKCNAQF